MAKGSRSGRRMGVEQRTIQEGRMYTVTAKNIHQKKQATLLRFKRRPRVSKPLVSISPTLAISSPKKNAKIQKSPKIPKNPTKVVRSMPTSIPKSRATLPAVRALVSQPVPKIQVNKTAKLTQSKQTDFSIPAFGFIDVCFCIDSTGSMATQLAQVQEVIKTIIHNIELKVQTEGLQLRFAIVSYRDHPPQESTYVTKHLDFTDQYEAIQYVKGLSAMGGGDEPEAAHDGLYLSAKSLNWAQVPGTPVLRYIFHIADAPPHGKQFSNIGQSNGCLCGLQTDDVIGEINKKCIHYRLIKTKPSIRLDCMEDIFRKKIQDFDSTGIQKASELNVKVSDMIIHEVIPDMV